MQRRRTQIRLAQRAYRQRKETTIAELNDKVAELQQIIDKMAKSVAVFQDHAAAAGLQHLNSQLSEDLQNVVLGLSSKASYNAPSQESRAVNEIPILSARTYGTEEASGIHAATRLSGLGTGQRATSLQHTQREIESSWGYTLTSETDSSDSHMADESGYSFYDQEDRSKSDVVAGKTIPDNLNITTDERNLIMSLTNKPLSSPATYSFRESTFARRLLRAAYERAYRVIMDPIRNEKTIAEMCKFTFCFNSIDKVRWWITKMNSTTTKDSLELWSAPQLHLGCAGLHYPRTSLDGDNGVLPSLWAEKEPVGPCRSAVAQTPMPDSMTVQEIIEETGFGGEWFDPNDVEHYLKNKGVFVDERSSLVELGVNEVSAMDLTMARAAEPPASYGSDSSHISPEMPDIQVPNEAPMQGTGAVHPFYTEGGHGIVDMDEEFEVLFGSVPSAPQALDQQSLFHDSYSSWEPVSKKLLDVDKFISSKLGILARH